MTYLELEKILRTKIVYDKKGNIIDSPVTRLKKRESELFELIPDLGPKDSSQKKCQGFNQNSIWHQYDLLEHIYHVVDGIKEDDSTLRLAALFHDIGKLYTERPGGHYPGHCDVSAVLFRKFAVKHHIPYDITNLVSKLIVNHDIRFRYSSPGIIDENLNESLIDELSETFTEEEINMLYSLRQSDLEAQKVPEGYVLNYDLEKKLILKRYENKKIR